MYSRTQSQNTTGSSKRSPGLMLLALLLDGFTLAVSFPCTGQAAAAVVVAAAAATAAAAEGAPAVAGAAAAAAQVAAATAAAAAAAKGSRPGGLAPLT